MVRPLAVSFLTLILLRRASELHLSIPTSKRRAVHASTPPASAFSTSTPARTQSPPPSAPFPEESPMPTQVLTQATLHISPARHRRAPLLGQPPDVRAMENDLEIQEEDVLGTARACVEAREFKRAIHILQDCRSSKARFLSIYSRFIVSSTSLSYLTSMTVLFNKATEKKAQRDWHKLDSMSLCIPARILIHRESE